MKNPRYEDFEIEYLDENMFAFMGNGFEVRESDGRDLTHYMGSLDREERDMQPEYGEEMVEKMAGWTLGDEYVVREHAES